MNKKTLGKSIIAVIVSIIYICIIITTVYNIYKYYYNKKNKAFEEYLIIMADNPVVVDEDDGILKIYNEEEAKYDIYKMSNIDTNYDIYYRGYNTGVNTKNLPDIPKDECTEITKLQVYTASDGSESADIVNGVAFPNLLDNEKLYQFDVNTDNLPEGVTKESIIYEIVLNNMIKNAYHHNELDKREYENGEWSQADKSNIYLAEGATQFNQIYNVYNSEAYELFTNAFSKESLSEEDINRIKWEYTKYSLTYNRAQACIWDIAQKGLTDDDVNKFLDTYGKLETSTDLLVLVDIKARNIIYNNYIKYHK